MGGNLTLEEKYQLYLIPFQSNKVTIADYQAMKKDKMVSSYKNVMIYYETHEKELVPIIEDVLNRADELTTNLLGDVHDNEIDLILHSSIEDLYEKTSLVQTMLL
ncbi:hypothetical protein [Metabacillus endolithicus]|uniref:hypothetical protein n=1 Tax=Metabacillus endolithicus TaxID=1535204 RepID=UPI001FF97A96|nr:hypothetical protein [Metabacillus endolithicus]UPG64936.1 hypothetical protein MVE64_07990 [Metabacillus endolithicus]